MTGGEKLCKWVVGERRLELVGNYRQQKVSGWWLSVAGGGAMVVGLTTESGQPCSDTMFWRKHMYQVIKNKP